MWHGPTDLQRTTSAHHSRRSNYINHPAEDNPDEILVNKLTIGSAQHILRIEGRRLTRSDVVFELFSMCLIFGSLAWAIVIGQVTIWHMFLPMIGEYLGYLFAVPAIQFFVRQPDLTKCAWQCVRNLGIYAAGIVIVGFVLPLWTEKGMAEQWSEIWRLAWNWIVGSGMFLPVLLAATYSMIKVRRNVSKLVEFGPPFAGPGLGCVIRILVFFCSALVIIFFGPVFFTAEGGVLENLKRIAESVYSVWVIWTLLLISELLCCWILWDIQRRLTQARRLPE